MASEFPIQMRFSDLLERAKRLLPRRSRENNEVVVRNERDWVNPWDELYEEIGIPEDLERPYFNFNFIISLIEDLQQPEDRVGKKKVLDVAMGPGRHAIALAEKGYEVYGFDLSENALELAKDQLSERGLSCDIKVGDMFERYDYPENFFDAVVAIQAIYHGCPPHMQESLNQIHRVLRPGGLLAFTVSRDCERPLTDTNGLRYKATALEDRDYVKVKGFEDTYVFLHGREEGLPHFYPNEEKLEDMLWEAGFNNLQMYKDSERRYRVIWCKSVHRD